MRLDHLLSKEKEGIERFPEFEIENKRARFGETLLFDFQGPRDPEMGV